jgi:ATP-dependent DNA helicase RecG
VIKRVPSLDDVPAELEETQFWNLFGRVEHEQLDFKRGTPDEVRNTIPAMAMSDGGLLVLGVDDNRKLVGCPLSQNTQDRITRFARECGVDVQLREIKVGEVPLTIVAVPEIRGRIVTTPDGRLLRRIGGDCLPLVSDALARFVREREERPGEDEIVQNFALEDVDMKVLNEVLKADGRPTVRRDAILRALVDLGVALPPDTPLGSRTLVAGVVLFAVDPSRYLPGLAVQLVRRSGVGPGPGPSIERIECRGALQRVLEQCLIFIDRHTVRFEVVSGTNRETIPEYPREVLREAILNALAHRDYGLKGATVDVTIWDDRIEVKSPGPLPGHITLENIRNEHYSRNRRVMRVLKTVRLVEEYGEGVDRMFLGMEERLMEPPVFLGGSGSVTVVLRNRFIVDVEGQVWLSLLRQYQLSPGERRVLVVCRSEGSVTPRRLRTLLPGVDIDGLLRGAVVKGLLLRLGERGGTRYVLSPEVVLRAGSQGLEAQSRRRQQLLDELRRRGSLSSTEGADLLGENIATIRGILTDLAHAGLIRGEGRTRGRRFFAVD